MRYVEVTFLREHLPNPGGLRVLDAGCGNCVYFLLLASQAHKYVGIDISVRDLIYARHMVQEMYLDTQAFYLNGSITALPFPDDVFDLVICNSVLEHVKNDQSALKELVRVLRPSGWLFLTVDCEYNKGTWLERLPRRAKNLLLKQEIAKAPTVSQGLRSQLARDHHVVHHYRMKELQIILESLGLLIVETRYYLTGLGAILYEFFYASRILGRRSGRAAFMVTSIVLGPLLHLVEAAREEEPGYGIAFYATKSGH